MQEYRAILISLLLGSGLAWGQKPPIADPKSPPREWTSTDGRKITATYLGVQNASVALRLPGGKITFVPTSKFSAEDNAFVQANLFDYRAAWQAWPPESKEAMALVPVDEDKNDPKFPGAFIYKTPHFRFIADVNLGTALMKDLARVFELTYHLHSTSPLGTLAKPENNGLFDAKLFGKTESYHTAGGPESTAGVYLLKEKVFLAPLDLMGVREGSTGWRKDSNYYDLSTIIHELTHMLTHGMLDNLPTWVNEGYAEYVANIPMEKNAFMTADGKIRDGVLDVLINYTDKIHGAKKIRTGVLSKADHINFAKQDNGPVLFKVEDVLMMNDVLWSTGSKTPPPPGTAFPPPKPPWIRFPGTVVTGEESYLRLPRLYRTAHLIIYYFIQIEGEKGVLKIRRFLEENQKNMARYQKYLEDFKAYQTKVAAFMNLPGVTKLDDGRIQYPSNLTPPVSPQAPFTDPDTLKLGGVNALLGGESASVVGARIEAALIEDLGVKLQFK
ncbi:MAG: hypothetical protein ABIS50_16960 [Luteolibacter sp.]|uniref:hypothetical protein n=1 Tax=Luteolibacter sp. TaxID=1962973 RepID=UPI003267A46C